MLATLESRGGPHPDLISEERQTEESNKSNQVETDGWMGGPTQPSSNQPGDGDGWSRTKREEGEERGAWNGITTSLPTGAGEKGAERTAASGS